MLYIRTSPNVAFSSSHIPSFRNLLSCRRTAYSVSRDFRRSLCRQSPVHEPSCCAVGIPPVTAAEALRTAATRGGLAKPQLDSLSRLADLLLDVNKQFNLTAIRTREGVILKHIVDALSLLPVLDKEGPNKIIDVGTGAGFPGFVLAIARPEWHVTLLESARKKTGFHTLVQNELSIVNVASVWARAEEVGQNALHREKYDVAVARSVAEMRVLAELCLPLVAVKGCVLAQKTVDRTQAEISGSVSAIKKLGGELESVDIVEHTKESDLKATQAEEERWKAIVVVRKRSKTSQRYPRSSGTPKKSPL